MARQSMRVEGLRELDAALGELSKSTARNVLKRVATQALQAFDARWRELAPRDTGTLSKSGAVGTKLTPRQARLARKDAKANGKNFAEVFAGPNDPAAVPQEFGTFDQPAQPFVRPAWEQTKGGALDTVKTELAGAIDKAAKRAAARAARLLR